MGRACQERGLYYFGLREYDKAIADLSQAIEIAFGLEMYDRYNLNAFRGKAFMGTGRYEEAVNDFTFAISVAPSPDTTTIDGLRYVLCGELRKQKYI